MTNIRVFFDTKPLNLMKHRRVCLIKIGTIGAPRADYPNGGRLTQHCADLDGAGVGAQEFALTCSVFWVGGEKERIMHVPRGMIGREVELGEIIIICLDVRPLGHRKAERGENGDDLIPRLTQGMNTACLQPRRPDGQGDV